MDTKKKLDALEGRKEAFFSGALIQSIFPTEISNFLLILDEQAKKISETIKPFQPFLDGLKQTTQEISRMIIPWAGELAELERRSNILKTSGWLPHYTFPFEVFDKHQDNPKQFNAAVSDYYQSQWPAIKKKLTDNIHTYCVDLETKEVFLEAQKLHEAKCFRSVPRLLFPEIERISRVDHHNNKMRRITSVPKLQELAGNLTHSDVSFHAYYSLEFFGRLIEHVYVSVNEGNLAQFKNDPVPNRHTTLHGNVVYNSFQSSLNMLFMADYIFQVISALRKSTNIQTDNDSINLSF